MESLSKKERTLKWFTNHSLELRCIYCSESLVLRDGSLICSNHHRFDMARQGYFFLAKQLSQTKYDQALFASRREIIMNSPLYGAFHEYMATYLTHNYNHRSESVILDAGSGEGSHLWQLRKQVDLELVLVGVDLSKAAIQYATSYNGDILSIVGDLADLPIQDREIDLILSILSPANYKEFDRVLKSGGEIIKVVPNKAYLIEIRQAMNELALAELEDYSNQEVVSTFYKHYPHAKTDFIRDQVTLNKTELSHLIKMTPLTWQLNESELSLLANHLQGKITLDLTILHA